MTVEPTDPEKRIVIIGGGFAGINLALKLTGTRFRVTLVDRNNFNYFPPLLYQVASGFLDASNISYPFRKLLGEKQPRKTRSDRSPTVQFRQGVLLRVDPSSHTCQLDNGELGYNYLVFAVGACTNYFGNENIRRYAIPMKTVDDALAMRNRLLQNLEQATITDNPVEKIKRLTIVVAGGGPTGVEVAGILAELKKNITKRDYPELSGIHSELYLVTGGPGLLLQMSPSSQQQTLASLTRLGVKVVPDTLVIDYDGEVVSLSNGEKIPAKNLIWAAGVGANLIEGIPSSSIGPGKRMITDAYNKVTGVEDIYAIGDTSIQFADPAFPAGHPQLAQVAIQQGRTLAKNFIAISKDRPQTPFRYFDQGTMAIVGRKKAVADLVIGQRHKKVLHLRGFLALLIWLFIHLMSLVNFRNKFKTLYNWAIAWLTGDQSLRMIVRPEKGDSQIKQKT